MSLRESAYNLYKSKKNMGSLGKEFALGDSDVENPESLTYASPQTWKCKK